MSEEVRRKVFVQEHFDDTYEGGISNTKKFGELHRYRDGKVISCTVMAKKDLTEYINNLIKLNEELEEM